MILPALNGKCKPVAISALMSAREKSKIRINIPPLHNYQPGMRYGPFAPLRKATQTKYRQYMYELLYYLSG